MAQCPHESELLAYAEKSLSASRRVALEAHMADCDDCRESLALFARISGEGAESVEPLDLSGDLIDRQTEKILTFIARDEAKQPVRQIRREAPKPERSGFFVSYAQLGLAATLVIVAAVALIYSSMDPRDAEAEGMRALALAIKDERRIPTPISGNFGYAPNAVTRGDRTSDELHFDISLNKLRFAEKSSAPAQSRILLAEVYLSRDKQGDAQRALDILQEVSASGVTPELLNDIGVAWFQLGDFPKAIEAFSEAFEKNPDFHKALFSRGLANERAGFPNAARKDFEQFINLTDDENWKREARERLQ